ncbi:phage head morphogenesis protein [Microvirgula aerodenitrificans]|uniref:phage head morphogenesis protein n=1 Tax=Microvirgula aerodenitrificans TaxID=57480 RepID=UPI00248E16A9|nr:phage minor head protein [Microvirgula aerodenitrificans]
MLTTDKKRRGNPVKTSRIERDYAAQLTEVARQVGAIINGFPPGDPGSAPTIEQILRRYTDAMTEWSLSTASRMIAAVNHQDARTWNAMAAEMSRALRGEIRNAPTGEAMRALLAEQVVLIKSIPLEAAQRVHRLTLEGIENGSRSSEIAREIMRSGDVAAGRARTIARTEVARTAAVLTQARAESIGSEGYIWRTSADGDVRESHRKMADKFVKWDEPPTLVDVSSTGKTHSMTGHAGCLPNCRCYPEPVIPK